MEEHDPLASIQALQLPRGSCRSFSANAKRVPPFAGLRIERPRSAAVPLRFKCCSGCCAASASIPTVPAIRLGVAKADEPQRGARISWRAAAIALRSACLQGSRIEPGGSSSVAISIRKSRRSPSCQRPMRPACLSAACNRAPLALEIRFAPRLRACARAGCNAGARSLTRRAAPISQVEGVLGLDHLLEDDAAGAPAASSPLAATLGSSKCRASAARRRLELVGGDCSTSF